MPLSNYPSMFPEGERPSGKGRFLVLDSEAIDLLFGQRKDDPSCMHCLVVKDDLSQEVFIFFDPYEKRDPNNREALVMEGEQDGYLWDGMQFLKEAECLISQNFSGYDALSFEKVMGKAWGFKDYLARRKEEDERSWYYPNKVMDTYVMSCVLNPERKVPSNAYMLGRGNVGAHSIEAHGIRMGRYKPENEDWSKLTDHMLHRCEEDTHIGQDFYHYLMKEWAEQAQRPNGRTGLSINTAYRVELQTAFSIARQAQRGFPFHIKKAIDRVNELTELIDATEKGFRPHMPLRMVKGKLDVPINGHTHGSKFNTVTSITKKLSPKAWCDYSKGKNFKGELSFDAELMLESGDKLSQKDWLSVCPAEQDNSVGEYAASVTKHYPECRGFITDYKDPIVVGEFTPVQWEEIPLGNRDSVKQVLHERGWLGINYNDTEQALIDDGNFEELAPWAGKIDEDSLEAWKKRDGKIPEWCEGIAAWYILSSRRNQILNVKDLEYFTKNAAWPKQAGGKKECRGLIPKCRHSGLGITAMQYFEQNKRWPTDDVGEWRVPAEAFTCATNTFRMRHKVVVNIPSRGLYPLRDLFIASKGKKILGCDGSGLELRMLSHFMNDPAYQEVVLNGDIHTYNQLKAGLPERDMAKTFIYAFLYGSGIANLASVCGLSYSQMEDVIANFKAQLPALTQLIERIQRQGEATGYLLAVDGRWGRARSKQGKMLVHTLLNLLLQMTGSISMKYGLCFAERQLEKERVGLDADGFVAWLVNMHDEMQMEIDEEEVSYLEYDILASEWKAEEKRIHIDADGKLWSAPHKSKSFTITNEDGSISPEYITVERAYHRAGQVIAEAITKAGEFLKLRCPLAGEYKIGDSWADTH